MPVDLAKNFEQPSRSLPSLPTETIIYPPGVYVNCLMLWALAFRVPFLPPLLHLGDLPLLDAYDVPRELLYPWVSALFCGDPGHLYGGPVVGDHGVYERPVEGF